MYHGVPEGFVEIKSGHAIPFDFNLDLMGAIEQNKGCYTGQELITRTFHQGQIRKRLHPIRLFDPDHEAVDPTQPFIVKPDAEMHVISETELMGATVKGVVGNMTDYTANYNIKMGRVIRVIGNVGIAVVREEHLKPGEAGSFAAAINDRPRMILAEIK
jgi:folate-binding protein YgfZ